MHRLEELKMSQKELAEKMKCSPQYVSKLLKGSENLTLDTISKLEECLDLNLVRDALSHVDGYEYHEQQESRRAMRPNTKYINRIIVFKKRFDNCHIARTKLPAEGVFLCLFCIFAKICLRKSAYKAFRTTSSGMWTGLPLIHRQMLHSLSKGFWSMANMRTGSICSHIMVLIVSSILPRN